MKRRLFKQWGLSFGMEELDPSRLTVKVKCDPCVCVSLVLNGPPMSVKKEREAELMMGRREQRSGEVICIDD